MIDKLIISEPPLQVLPGLARAIGLNEAIALQQLHYLLRHTNHVFADRKWVCLSYGQWQVMHYPFWSVKTVARTYGSLVSQHLATSSATHNRFVMDMTKWYTIEYDALAKLAEGMDLGREPAGDSDPCQATLLLPEQPLQVLPSLAVAVGLHEAIVLQQLHYLLRLSSERRDGRQWVCLTYDVLVEKHLSCMTERTVRRAIKSLESAGLLLFTEKYNRHFLDNTKWYSINYFRLNQTIRSVYEDNSSNDYNVLAKGQNGQTSVPETNNNSTTTDSAIMSLQKDKMARRQDKMARLREDKMARLREDKMARRSYKVEESKKKRDDNRETVVVVSSATSLSPQKINEQLPPPSGGAATSEEATGAGPAVIRTRKSRTIRRLSPRSIPSENPPTQIDGVGASAPPAVPDTIPADASIRVAPGSIPSEDPPTQVDANSTQVDGDEDAIAESLRDTPLYNLISRAAIRNAIAAYNPVSHPDCQPESPVEGVRRLCDWMGRIACDPNAPGIRNPAGFLISLSRRGMDKPACIVTKENAVANRQKDIDDSRRNDLVRQLQNEYPGAVVEDVLNELPDLQYPVPTDEQMKALRIKLETAQVRAETARLKALAECRLLLGIGGRSGGNGTHANRRNAL